MTVMAFTLEGWEDSTRDRPRRRPYPRRDSLGILPKGSVCKRQERGPSGELRCVEYTRPRDWQSLYEETTDRPGWRLRKEFRERMSPTQVREAIRTQRREARGGETEEMLFQRPWWRKPLRQMNATNGQRRAQTGSPRNKPEGVKSMAKKCIKKKTVTIKKGKGKGKRVKRCAKFSGTKARGGSKKKKSGTKGKKCVRKKRTSAGMRCAKYK